MLKMWLLCIVLLSIVNFSHQFNISKDLTKMSIPELYAQHMKEYIRRNKEENLSLCHRHMDEYANKLKNSINPWALQWFDSGTKIPSGFLKGYFSDLGNFDECVKTKTSIDDLPVYGKYCLGHIPININKIVQIIAKIQQSKAMVGPQGTLGFTFATCMPESCNSKEIQDFYTKEYLPKIVFSDESCYSQSTKPKLTSGDIAFITVLGIVLLIIILSTIYDIYLFYANKKPLHVLLKAFSVYTNGKKLITFSKNSNQISCLHGIRAISMMWIILSHRFVIFAMHPIRNILDLLQWINTEGNMYILGATVSVDTFLLLSGLVVSYVFMSAMAKGNKFNIFIFYIHRYLRLTPLFAVIMVLYITILRHLGSGPYWNKSITALQQPCRENWWTSLLYVQNYVNKQASICIPQTWYLSVDTQLYVMAPLILIPLWKWPKVGIMITSSFGVATMLTSFIIGYVHELRGFILANKNSQFFQDYYITTHTRATPWFMGILLGYYIFNLKKNKQKIIINKLLVLLIWIVALGILATCVFTGHNTISSPYDRIGNAFYVALMRPGWSLALSAIIVLCEVGYGGPINWFLSLPVFEFLSRLTYSMYLIHMGLITVIIAQNRSAPDLNDLTVLHGFWGDYIFTVCTAIIFTLAFESPIVSIEKVLLGGRTEKNENNNIESIKTIRHD